MREDREELSVYTPRTQSAEVRVHLELISARVRQEPPQDRNPVGGCVTFGGVGSVHSEIEAVVENEGRHVVVPIYNDRFAVDPLRLLPGRLWIARVDHGAEARERQ